MRITKAGYYGHDDGKDSRSKQWKKERKTRGFDDTELWSLGDTIVEFILPRLKAFDDKDYVELIEGLELFIRDNGIRLWNTEEEAKVNKALKELGESLPGMWY